MSNKRKVKKIDTKTYHEKKKTKLKCITGKDITELKSDSESESESESDTELMAKLESNSDIE